MKNSFQGIVAMIGICACLFSGCSSSPKSVEPKGAPAQKRVVAYFCEWGIYDAHGNYYVPNIPFGKVTHINYAFVGLNPQTQAVEVYDSKATREFITPGDPSNAAFKGNLGMFRKMKATYPNVRVLLSVGGWTKSHGFHAAALTAESRKEAAKNLVAFMAANGLDGLDIDWEFPGVNRAPDPADPYDKGAPGGPEDKKNYTLFLKELRKTLDAQGKLDGKRYELTAAVGVSWKVIDLTEPGKYAEYLDAVNLMTYDMHGAFESTIGHQAPLHASPADTQEARVKERYNIDWVVSRFLELGVPAGKIVVGIPFYSRGWDNVSGGVDIDGDGRPDGMFGTGGAGLAGIWGGGGQSPYYAIKPLETAQGWEKYRDPANEAVWLYNRDARELYTYDDAKTVAVKTDYILARNLGGAMYWEIDGDDWKNGYDLANIIADKLISRSGGK